jgi:hypothetical protein
MSKSVSSLYKDIIRVAASFKDKNFREYFTRIAKDDFERVKITMPEEEFIKKQFENLAILERQATIQNMYYTETFTVKR